MQARPTLSSLFNLVSMNYSQVRCLLLFLQGWVLFQQLLIDLFKFLAPFLRNAELAKQTHLLYKVSNSPCKYVLLLLVVGKFDFYRCS